MHQCTKTFGIISDINRVKSKRGENLAHIPHFFCMSGFIDCSNSIIVIHATATQPCISFIFSCISLATSVNIKSLKILANRLF